MSSRNESIAGMSHHSCERWPITSESLRFSAWLSRKQSLPSSRASPWLNGTIPVRHLTSVVLPAPF
ncbi:MAG TPA: hypothetical protein VK509_23755 [Polyangiales bacterium]|nr:hypothetical protein [Polyangiales bacterium]